MTIRRWRVVSALCDVRRIIYNPIRINCGGRPRTSGILLYIYIHYECRTPNGLSSRLPITNNNPLRNLAGGHSSGGLAGASQPDNRIAYTLKEREDE